MKIVLSVDLQSLVKEGAMTYDQAVSCMQGIADVPQGQQDDARAAAAAAAADEEEDDDDEDDDDEEDPFAFGSDGKSDEEDEEDDDNLVVKGKPQNERRVDGVDEEEDSSDDEIDPFSFSEIKVPRNRDDSQNEDGKDEDGGDEEDDYDDNMNEKNEKMARRNEGFDGLDDQEDELDEEQVSEDSDSHDDESFIELSSGSDELSDEDVLGYNDEDDGNASDYGLDEDEVNLRLSQPDLGSPVAAVLRKSRINNLAADISGEDDDIDGFSDGEDAAVGAQASIGFGEGDGRERSFEGSLRHDEIGEIPGEMGVFEVGLKNHHP